MLYEQKIEDLNFQVWKQEEKVKELQKKIESDKKIELVHASPRSQDTADEIKGQAKSYKELHQADIKKIIQSQPNEEGPHIRDDQDDDLQAPSGSVPSAQDSASEQQEESSYSGEGEEEDSRGNLSHTFRTITEARSEDEATKMDKKDKFEIVQQNQLQT